MSDTRLPGDVAWDEYVKEHYPTFGDPGLEIRGAFAAGWNARRLYDLDEPNIPPITDEPLPYLDPQPWILNSSGVFGVRGEKDGGSSPVGWYWSFAPRPEYEQDRTKYE